MNAVERIKEIFSQALEKKAGPERDNFLAAACREDSELRGQMESLLHAHERAGEFLGKTMRLPSSEVLIERSGKTLAIAPGWGTMCFLRAPSLAELDAQHGLK